MDVIVFCGQSNMQGQTEGIPAVNHVVRYAYEYRYLSDTFVSLKHPVGEDISVGEESVFLRAHKGGGSLIPAFCREYVRRSGKKTTAIHVAKGATKIEEWLPGTTRYRVLTDKINKGIEKAKSIERVEKICFVWFQGCSDAIEQTSYDTYKKMFVELKNSLKRDTGITEFGLIRVGYFASVVHWLKTGATAAERKVWDETIMRAQEDIARENDDCAILTRICSRLVTDKRYVNPEEDGHYNNAGMERIGKSAAINAIGIWG